MSNPQKELKAISERFSSFLLGHKKQPTPEEIRDFQKRIIRASKTIESNNVRKISTHIEPTKENPLPNTKSTGLELGPPIDTSENQTLLKKVIEKINNG